MHKDLQTDVDIAIYYLKSKEGDVFEETLTAKDQNDLFNIVLLYYSAMGQLIRKIQTFKVTLTNQEQKTFDRNKIRLKNLKEEIEKSDLEILSEKYNDAIIMSSLVQAIRDNEANILTYNTYLKLKEKFMHWPKIGIKSDKILLTWKNFSNALHELEDWLTEKKDNYLPNVEKLIAAFETSSASYKDFYAIIKTNPEKESFYLICNVLLTNPILRKDFLSLSMLQGERLLHFEINLFNVLKLLNENTMDTTLKGLILLFQQQIQDLRPELVT